MLKRSQAATEPATPISNTALIAIRDEPNTKTISPVSLSSCQDFASA
jgi:hypothetical protein